MKLFSIREYKHGDLLFAVSAIFSDDLDRPYSDWNPDVLCEIDNPAPYPFKDSQNKEWKHCMILDFTTAVQAATTRDRVPQEGYKLEATVSLHPISHSMETCLAAIDSMSCEKQKQAVIAALIANYKND